MEKLKVDLDTFYRVEFKRRMAARHADALRSALQASTPARAAVLSRVADVLTFYTSELARITGMLPDVAESESAAHWEKLFDVYIDGLKVYPSLDAVADSGSIVLMNQALDYFKSVTESFPLPTAEELSAMLASGQITAEEYAQGQEIAA